MKHINFTYNLDRTFADGADEHACRKARSAGKNVTEHLYKKETGLYLSWSFSGKYYKEYTGIKILPAQFNWRQRLPERSHSNHLELSTLLTTILSKVQREYLRMRTDGIALTGDTIREMVRCIIHGDHTTPEKGLFWKVYDEFMEEKKVLAASATIVKYETLRKHLHAFEKLKYPMSFEAVTMQWYNEFQVYCIQLNLKTNTVGKLFAMIKAFMNHAYDRKFTRNLEFKRFRVRTETTDPVYLTLEELSAIEKLNIGANSGMAFSRDLFLVGSYTGQRISDLVLMKRKDLKKVNDEVWWEVRQVKTRKRVRVFIINKVRKILDKYLSSGNPDGYVFPRISPVVINRHLKTIGKAAGLETEVTRINYSGNKKIEVTKAKYLFLTTHVARRTFITALSAGNMPDHEIQMLSGHSSVKELKVYKGRNADSIRNQMIALFEPISIVKSA